jgi:hypothetical protein
VFVLNAPRDSAAVNLNTGRSGVGLGTVQLGTDSPPFRACYRIKQYIL